MLYILIEQINGLSFAAIRKGSLVRLRHRPDIDETGIGTDWLCFFANQLQSIVVGRVVAGGHHDAAVGI